ncbi:MAG: OmpA family protein [Pseudoxanthomonas sp.]
MFDAIIRQAAERFGLGDNAKQFVGQLLALIFNPDSGGISGFLQKFKDAGLGNLASSWVGGTPGDNDLQPDQVQAALGSDALSSLASKAGIPASAASVAIAGLLPKIIGALTPDGQLPTSIPASISGLIPGLGNLGAGVAGTATGIGNAARGAGDALGAGAGAASAAAGRAAANVGASASAATSGGLGFLKWLIPLAIVLGLGYCAWNKRGHAPAAADTAPAAEVAAPVEEAAPPATEVAPIPDTTATAPTPEAAAPTADAALDALQAGSFTADDLVKALNLTGIQFDTGSSRISATSQDILGKAAEALKKAPEGTRVEIGGYTDNTGNAAANLKLSESRATAVRARLVELGVSDAILTAKGYGDAKPVADNGTAEGRAKNRRMEFSLAQ